MIIPTMTEAEIVAEGVALGYVSAEGNILFKTFVTYDMLKGEQIAKFIENEKIRQEIHG